MIINKKILVVSDVPNWAFDKIPNALKKYCKNWDVNIYHLDKTSPQEHSINLHEDYDIILYLCDYKPENLLRVNIPREKVIIAIRSHVNHPFYDDIDTLNKSAAVMAVSNQKLYERFTKIHSNVVLIEGGVDTDLFIPSKRPIHKPMVVGWAGTNQNVPKDFRGLRTIQYACNKVGMIFNPALRELKWRTEEEMVKYYQDEIDIYIDLSKTAGRQNGLLEAGSCGKLIMCYNTGVASQVIRHGINGIILYERTFDSLVNILRKVQPWHIPEFRNNIIYDIREKWSWEYHAKKFEKLFNKMLEERNA